MVVPLIFSLLYKPPLKWGGTLPAPVAIPPSPH